MEKNKLLIECNSCGDQFEVSELNVYPRMVRKGSLVAVAYCFRCSKCKQEYACYFKDSQVMAMFRKGQRDEARERMSWLKGVFTNDNSV